MNNTKWTQQDAFTYLYTCKNNEEKESELKLEVMVVGRTHADSSSAITNITTAIVTY